MKNRWGLSYKKGSKILPVSLKQDNIRKFFESAGLLFNLSYDDYELIYIDECSINTRNDAVYEWSSKGKPKHVLLHADNLSFSLIMAFSNKKFYGLVGWKCTVNSDIFIYFI